MKHIKFRLVILLCTLIHSLSSYAYDALIDGIYYNLDNYDYTAEVIRNRNDKYSGNVSIPKEVSYNGNKYSVTSIGNDAFAGCSGLTSVTIPNSVTSIGNDAFWSCIGLTSVTIPNSVTSIGEYAFKDCSSLTSVTIPNSVTSIGNVAFSYCSGLTSVTIPNSVTSIGVYAFAGCSSLSLITVDANNPKYDSRDNCNAIIEKSTNTLIAGCKTTIIPNSVTSIGEGAFRGCSSLTSVTIPNSVTSIGNWAFYNCSGLTSVTIPNSVTSIGYAAFEYCSSMTSVKSEIENPFEIESGVFQGIASNVILIVPKGTKAKYQALSSWSSYFKEIVEDNKDNSSIITFADPNVKAICVSNWDTNGDGELSEEEAAAVVDLGNVFNNKIITSFDELQYFTGLTSIGRTAFSWCGLTSLTIPSSVTSIGVGAFYQCDILDTVTIPSSVTSIDSMAFYICSDLTSLTIPSSVTSIGDRAFSFCSSLTSIIVDSKNKTYDSRDNCNAIIETSSNTLIAGCKNTIIPNSVTSIGNYAFNGCSSLTSVTIPSSVTSIGSSAFRYCSGLTSVTIPSSVASIGGEAFYGCRGLTSVTIPSSVTSIGDNAFGCNELTSIIVNSNNKTYDSRDNCNAIIETTTNTLIVGCKNTIIPNSVTSIGDHAFYICSGLTSVTIPSSVTSIGKSAFRECNGLTSVTIPSSVTSIGEGAFQGCSGLTSVTIPSSVTSIGDDAFINCTSLTSVTVAISQPLKIGYLTFSHHKNATLYVPAGSKTAYEAAAYWREFKEIVELPSNNIIQFADTNVKALCVANWDTDGDGELSDQEAAAVTDLGKVFVDNKSISSFDELQFFTGLTIIGRNDGFTGGFCGCSQLKNVIIPNSVTTIGSIAFAWCSSLTSVTIPNSVTSIGRQAFDGCSLVSITIPKSVTSIEQHAFNNCRYLTSITIPISVINLGDYIFENCDNLESIIVDANNLIYDSRNNCNAIIEKTTNTLIVGCKATTIPNTVTCIGHSAFFGCSGLTSVTIPSSVTSIGSWAFCNCRDLTSVMIPSSVTSIGFYAFSSCSKLKEVFSEIEIPFEIYDVFSGISSDAKLIVPAGTKAKYQAFSGWTANFKEIIEEGGDSSLMGDANGDGIVNVSDIVEVVNCIMGKPSDKIVMDAVDLTGDGVINVADIVKLVSIVMGQSNVRQIMAEAGTTANNDQLSMAVNTDCSISLLLTNKESYTASQFDVRLSEGQSLEGMVLNKERTADHQLVYTYLGNNTYRVMVYSLANSSYEGQQGELLRIKVSGDGTVDIDNILFITGSQQEKHFDSIFGNTVDVSALNSNRQQQVVFTIDGRAVRQGDASKAGLAKGIYIINGKKHVVR